LLSERSEESRSRAPDRQIQLTEERKMNLLITPAAAQEQPILENLMQYYQYDFSEICGDDCNEQGRFVDEHLHLYWIEPERHPFLIRVDGKLAGFALIRQMVELEEDPAPYSIAEFFVMRKYRRQGVGEKTAYDLFDRFPGKWHVAEIPENVSAIRFWRNVIASYTAGKYEEAVDPNWEGPVQKFFSSGSHSIRTS
jgi:predicted acetyltransferase